MMVGVVFLNGKIVPGTGREVTREEKLNVINFFKSQKIPLYDNVYNVALRRYLKGTLKLEAADEEKNKKL